MLNHSQKFKSGTIKSASDPEVIVYVLGPATTGKSTLAAQLYEPKLGSTYLPPRRCLRPLSFKFDGTFCMVVDTPGFDHDSTYDEENFESIEKMIKTEVRRRRNNRSNTVATTRFSAIYCYPIAPNPLGTAARRDLQALLALCKHFGFDSFTIMPVWFLYVPANQKERVTDAFFKHPQIVEIQENGCEVFEPGVHPDLVADHIISKAIPFNPKTPREGAKWAQRLAIAKSQLQPQPSESDPVQEPKTHETEPQEPETEQLQSRLKQAEDFNKYLLRSMGLPAYNLEGKTLAKDFEDLNREVGRIVKAIARHFKAERTIGVDKLLVGPTQFDAMHKLLSNDQEEHPLPSLYQSKTSGHMSVKLFLQSATALVVCKALHEQAFQPIYPGLEGNMSKRLAQVYQNVQSTNNDTMSGKWRRDTFIGLQHTDEHSQELQSAISLSIKNNVFQILQILYGDPAKISAQQKTAFAGIARPLASIDVLVRNAFDLNRKVKTEAILIGSFSTMYFPPGATFDPDTMMVHSATDGRDEEAEGSKTIQNSERTILSTFGLGLIMENASPIDELEHGRERVVVGRATVTDESCYDVVS